ncbi:MAG: twin-arginine translocase TatA/TatE family subunit [Calditrichaeota bacterium]|nr:MAG: twin-arginine translocase TatA/TatE family subunit [Calditrichota bacterium]
MFGLSPTELMIVFVVFILLFGAKRLPEIAKGLGRGLKEFRSELKSLNEPLTKE